MAKYSRLGLYLHSWFDHAMSKVRLYAGFRSADVDIKNGNPVYRAAVSKRHPMFGALKGLVRIDPGTDLTDPADPEWAGTIET
jgi:hypothetical protein